MATRSDLGEIARGLLTLEINTVQKDGMSAQKMPGPSHALLDIIYDYWRFLCARAEDFAAVDQIAPWARPLTLSFQFGREPFSQDPDAPHRHDMADRQEEQPPAGYRERFLESPEAVASFWSFDDLREIAQWTMQMRRLCEQIAADPGDDVAQDIYRRVQQLHEGAEVDMEEAAAGARDAARRFRSEHHSVLHRIFRNSDQFKKTIKDRFGLHTGIGRHTNPPAHGPNAAPPNGYVRALVQAGAPDVDARFAADDLVQIRKAWDIGTEIVLMQTVVQLDGDVVTRFQAGVDSDTRAALHAIHARGVDISLKYWGGLVDAVGRAAGMATSVLLGKHRG